jgi:hypothetical protein
MQPRGSTDELLRPPALPGRLGQYIAFLCDFVCGGEERRPGCREQTAPNGHTTGFPYVGTVPDAGEIAKKEIPEINASTKSKHTLTIFYRIP